jgi:hypothetical protein
VLLVEHGYWKLYDLCLFGVPSFSDLSLAEMNQVEFDTCELISTEMGRENSADYRQSAPNYRSTLILGAVFLNNTWLGESGWQSKMRRV